MILIIIEINTADKYDINWNAKGHERSLQNVINLLNTVQYEVAYDRTLGLSADITDKPFEDASSKVITEIYDLITEKEPAATVEDISFAGIDNCGQMQFKVVLDIE